MGHEEIVKALLDVYVETGRTFTARELAEHVGGGVSERVVRTALEKHPHVGWEWGTRERYSRDYKWMTVGVSRVKEYEPTRRALRMRIRELQRERDERILSIARADEEVA